MKRYVMLENKEIVDRTKAQEFSVYDREPIKLQSDNLLDLVEVGDCVEYKDNNHLDYNITFIESDAFIDQFKHIDNEEVIAIWKREGDIMRRYEV